MRAKLTKGEAVRTIENGVHGSGEPYKYEVHGLPEDQTARLVSTTGERWRIHRTKDGATEYSSEDYATADDALATLQKEFD